MKIFLKFVGFIFLCLMLMFSITVIVIDYNQKIIKNYVKDNGCKQV